MSMSNRKEREGESELIEREKDSYEQEKMTLKERAKTERVRYE